MNKSIFLRTYTTKSTYKVLYEHDCHIISTKFSWNRNLSNFLYCEYLFSFYLDLRFSSFFLQQYLKFLRSLACGGFHFYFVTQHSVSDLSLYDQISGRLRFNANSVTLKEGNWFPGTLTNWKFSKDLNPNLFLETGTSILDVSDYPSVVVIFDTPKDNYAVSEALKLDTISCIFADSQFNMGSRKYAEIVPLTVGFSYKKVIRLLLDLSIEAIIEGDTALFRSFSKSKK